MSLPTGPKINRARLVELAWFDGILKLERGYLSLMPYVSYWNVSMFS